MLLYGCPIVEMKRHVCMAGFWDDGPGNHCQSTRPVGYYTCRLCLICPHASVSTQCSLWRILDWEPLIQLLLFAPFVRTHWHRPNSHIQQEHVPFPIMYHSEQKCAHFCSEWCVVGYGIYIVEFVRYIYFLQPPSTTNSPHPPHSPHIHPPNQPPTPNVSVYLCAIAI